MSVCFAWLLAAVASVGAATVTFEVRQPGTAAGSDGEQVWPAPPAQFADGVTAIGDLVYAQPLRYRPLLLDLYRPRESGPLPLVIYVHGGAWRSGNKRQGGPIADFPAVLAQLAARGFVLASIEYRLDGEATFPAAIHDVKTAIRFLRSHARQYGIDPTRVGIFGGSAGGQLAALAATSCGVEALEPDAGGRPPEASDCVQAAAPWYGVYDFQTVPIPRGSTGPAPYLGCATAECPAETLRFASPVTYVDATDPPMLLIHGNADKLVAVSQTHEFEELLHKAGVPVEAIYIDGADHGLVGKDEQATLIAIRRALEATFDFFERTFRD
jgi:acetyl esterase/lipase